jgi:hypothetical protein
MSLIAFAPFALSALEYVNPVFEPALHSGPPYAKKLQVRLPFRGAEYTLELQLNDDLFAPGWRLEQHDGDGNLVRNVTDPTRFMCHYHGSVRGDNSSSVTLSTCTEIGLHGYLHLASQDLTIGLRTMSMLGSSSPQHVVFELDDEDFGTQAVAEEVAAPFDDAPLQLQGLPSSTKYVNREGFVSDEYRMKDFKSSNAEAADTQANLNTANKMYSKTNWGSGNTIHHQIKIQQQTPSGWKKHSKPYSKPKDAGEPFHSYCTSQLHSKGATGCTLLNGKEGAWPGGAIGESCVGCMCGQSPTSNLKMKASASYGPLLFAHEWGHRFSFKHIQDDNSCIMYPSASSGDKHFCKPSIDLWNTNRGKFTCLL